MGVLDKFLDAIKLNDDYDDDELLDDSILEEEDDYEDDFLDDEDFPRRSQKKRIFWMKMNQRKNLLNRHLPRFLRRQLLPRHL